MCGIAGYFGLNDEDLLKRMIGAIRHRGPDDVGFFVDRDIGLANARLSIIDIEGGHQPIHNEQGTIHVTYNGEIYNFQELRDELSGKGHHFYTKSDTEVIVHGYEEYGESVFNKLNGMFAIAIWDSPRRRLVLARDRMGIKPLHYAIVGATLFFGSEIKAILEASIQRTVDKESLFALLNVGYIPGAGTLLSGIRKLPPSTYLVYQNGNVTFETYWSSPPVNQNSTQDELAVRLRTSLQNAARDQLVADVPVGCFLSGGLDTSTIVAFASKASTQPVKTFCMGFGEETDEFEDARQIAERFGTDHHEIVVDSSDAVRLYPKMIWHMEAPKYNLYPWFVCELVRKYVKVCLSGNGGDEIFGGYVSRYKNALKLDKLAKSSFSPMIRSVARALTKVTSDPRRKNRLRALESLDERSSEYLLLAGLLPDDLNGQLFKDEKLYEASLESRYAPFFRDSDFLQGLIDAELRTKLVDDLLAVDDTMSMAHSLELRVPLLDNRIVDLMVSVPWRRKYSPETSGKLLLREAVKDILPTESFKKPKWGFSVDVGSWYASELGELVHQIVPESEVLREYFNAPTIGGVLLKAKTPKNRRYQVLAWQMLGFHFWHRIFIDADRPGASSLQLEALTA